MYIKTVKVLSAILLETNGIKIEYFFIAEQVNDENLYVMCCPTNEMVADFFTKPL